MCTLPAEQSTVYAKLDFECFYVLFTNENPMPVTIEGVRAYATDEEIFVALRDVHDVYEEPAF